MKAEEIKNELVKRGWEQGKLSSIFKEYAGMLFRYDCVDTLQITNVNHHIIIEKPTLKRIKALVFGLTGTKI
jgi:hypothetical protein